MSPDDPTTDDDAPDEPVVNPVLVQVAELRANGRSWKATAEDLGKPIEEIKRLANEDRPAFRKLLSASRKEMIEDAFAESVVVLRRHIRKDKNHKDAAFAATVLVKLWMTIVRHRPRPRGVKAEKPMDERTAELHRLADYIGGLSEEEKSLSTVSTCISETTPGRVSRRKATIRAAARRFRARKARARNCRRVLPWDRGHPARRGPHGKGTTTRARLVAGKMPAVPGTAYQWAIGPLGTWMLASAASDSSHPAGGPWPPSRSAIS
jgi:hypothetical protein